MPRSKTWRRLGLVAVALVVVAGILIFRHTRAGDDDTEASTAAPRVKMRTGIVATGPAAVKDADVGHDRFAGELRLEGQVVDEEDHPIGGAVVTLWGQK